MSTANSSIFQRANIGPIVQRDRSQTIASIVMPISRLIDLQRHLPLANSQAGNLFRDRFAANQFWYLPIFELAADPDAAFRFTATQNGVDAAGAPFNRATLILTLQKRMPDDAAHAQTENTAATFSEISLEQLAAVLAIRFKDANGADQQNTYPGTIEPHPDGSIRLTFDSILGVGAIIAYENLTHDAGAQLTLSASYAVWWLVPTLEQMPPIWTRARSRELPIATRPSPLQHLTQIAARPELAASILSEQTASAQIHAAASPVGAATRVRVDDIIKLPIDTATAARDDRTRYTQGSSAFKIAIAFGLKYAGAAYTQRFTIADGTTERPIISTADLKSYNVRQSEFSEFHGLGDISAKYPSFSRLYLGILSRTIIAVPARYGIVRGSAGCAAVCQALLDSSPVQASHCRFQFAFLLGPTISAIDLWQLSQDIQAHPDLKDYQLQLPSQLDSHVESLLVTPFKSSCIYTEGSSLHTFALAIEIKDDPSIGPAVANANLFIKQLSTAMQPYLVGRIGIKLDDYYPTPIVADVVLNFNVTSSTDDLGFMIDAAQQSVVLINSSPLDLQLLRYAYATPGQLAITSLQQALASQQTLALPLPAEQEKLDVLVERALALEQPLTKQQLGRYLAFQTQDVQEIQYDLGINASGVNFKARGINQLKVQISFTDLPNITVPLLTLAADHTIGSVRIVVPIEYAISMLAATIAFTVQYIDTQQTPLAFTRDNDFIDHAIFVLHDTDL
jgi:hypothetical protein